MRNLWWILVPVVVGCRAQAERAVTVYAGPYTDNSLPEEIALLQPLDFESATLVAGAYSEVLGQPSPSASSRWEAEVNIASWYGNQNHWEFNGLVVWRWMNFPWDHVLDTSFGLGNGLSYATSSPDLEESFHPDTGTSQLLYYIAVEFDFAPPSWDHWSTVLRVHHRSGVFGLFDDVDGGSNVLAIGLRYTF